MREAVRLADLAVLTVPREKGSVASSGAQMLFHSYGANLPSPETAWMKETAARATADGGCILLSPGRVGAEEVKQSWKRCAMWRRGLACAAGGCWPQPESAEKLLRESLHGWTWN